jgi:hypothetical protein
LAAPADIRLAGELNLSEVTSTLLVFVLLCTSAVLGMAVGSRLPEHHRTRATVELMQLAIGLLATFAAIVLGLLTASVKQAYDNAALDRQRYALQLSSLDQCLRDYGPETTSVRADIRSYTAAVIASTWPTEPPPKGVSYPDTSQMPHIGATPVLARLMDKIGLAVSELMPADPQHVRMAATCLDSYKDVWHARLSVVEDARNQLFDPFYQVLVLWLIIIFICFGLVAPRNALSMTILLLCTISLTSVIFVILDLSRPYGGVFNISSASMRNALDLMLSSAP